MKNEVSVKSKNKMTYEEYTSFLETSEEKYELIDGELYAMVGVSRNHDSIAVKFISQLDQKLGGTQCRVQTGEFNLRVKTEEDYNGYFPDIHVTCSDRDSSNRFSEQPTLIVEILSPSTEKKDRGKKLEDYKTIESLKEYLIVHQDKVIIERYTKNKEGDFVIDLFMEDSTLVLHSLGIELDTNVLYQNASIE